MCGIIGLFNPSLSVDELTDIAHKMSEKIINRGPDDNGTWVDEKFSLVLAHRRLAILDLTNASHQPMKSISGRYVCVFNGEIYNYLEIRKEINNSNTNFEWKGHGDTETLLAAIDLWGIDKTLQKLVGMFAIAIWDREEKTLKLIRDRFGEKPLYYGKRDGMFIFCSDTIVLKAIKGFNIDIDLGSAINYFNYGYISCPSSIHKGFKQLPNGTYISIYLGSSYDIDLDLLTPKKWWDPKQISEKCSSNRFKDTNEAISLLELSLRRSINFQSFADVPVGSFLSGGIDSTLITTLLQQESSLKASTFTIKFPNDDDYSNEYDESLFAKSIANYLGTNHHEVDVSYNDVLKVIPQLPEIYSEPFSDPSQVPTHIVCREARKSGLKVALSGDGGDELFGGYNRHVLVSQIHNYFGNLPDYLRSILSSSINRIPLNTKGLNIAKKQKFSNALKNASSLEDLYNSLILIANKNIFNHEILKSYDYKKILLPNTSNEFEKIMLADTFTYLPNDILVKVDRASMFVGLETRAPFLDHRIAEIAWRMNIDLKIKSQGYKNIRKWCLKQILHKYIPQELFDRPKQGFSMPIAQWLRGPLKEWANDLLSINDLEIDGILSSKSVRKAWDSHLNLKQDNSSILWTILMWQSWRKTW